METIFHISASLRNVWMGAPSSRILRGSTDCQARFSADVAIQAQQMSLDLSGSGKRQKFRTYVTADILKKPEVRQKQRASLKCNKMEVYRKDSFGFTETPGSTKYLLPVSC
jgi:hypothetical protein